MRKAVRMSQPDTEPCSVDPAEGTEKGVIAGLMQPYLRELSPFSGAKTAGDGRYHYPFLALYWKEADRYPFIIRVGKRVAGFALVRSTTAGTQMAEFYIAPEHRKQGIGRAAAHMLFGMFPGKWAVHQLLDHTDGQGFWRRAVSTYKNGDYGEKIETVKDKTYTVQRFES